MEQPDRRPTTANRLAADVAPGRPDLAAELAAAIGASSRVRSFVEANRTKIRRKVQGAADDEALRDVRVELLAAIRLLRDRRLELAWEEAGGRAGGPDFTVTWRANTRLLVEVTRRRGLPAAPAVADAVLAKLRQLPPAVPTVLVVAFGELPPPDGLAAALAGVRRRMEARDEMTLERSRVATPRELNERFLRLAAVVLWAADAPAGERTTAWTNASARFRLDPGVITALREALAG